MICGKLDRAKVKFNHRYTASLAEYALEAVAHRTEIRSRLEILVDLPGSKKKILISDPAKPNPISKLTVAPTGLFTNRYRED